MTANLKQKADKAWRWCERQWDRAPSPSQMVEAAVTASIEAALVEALAPVLERVARLENPLFGDPRARCSSILRGVDGSVPSLLCSLDAEHEGPHFNSRGGRVWPADAPKPPAPCATCNGAMWVWVSVDGASYHRKPCPDCSKPAAGPEGTLQHNPGLGSVTMSTEQAAALLKSSKPAEPDGKPDWADWMATNEYHQSLGAKWMCEAIVSKYAPDEREFVHAFARKWEDASFWRPKTEPAPTAKDAEYVRADLLEAAEAKLDHSQRKYRASCRHIEELAREDEEKRARLEAAERRIAELEKEMSLHEMFLSGRAEGREAGIREAAIEADAVPGGFAAGNRIRALLAKKPEVGT